MKYWSRLIILTIITLAGVYNPAIAQTWEPDHLHFEDYNVDGVDRHPSSYPPSYPSSRSTFDGNYVYVNFALNNDRSYDVWLEIRVSWYRPDGTLDYRYLDPEDYLVQSGYWWTFSYDFNGYTQCPGGWEVIVEVKETPRNGSGTTSWQDIIEHTFEVLDSKPDATNLQISNTNPNVGETVTVSCVVEDAAQYSYQWSDGNQGGTFQTGSGTINDDCPQNRTITTQYTVPNKPGQSISIEFTATNGRGSNDTNRDLAVISRYTLEAQVHADSAGRGSVSPNTPTLHNAGTSATASAHANTGFVFSHWSGDATGSTTPVNVGMDGDKLVYAHFVRQPVTLTTEVEPSAGGQILNPRDGEQLYYNDSLTLTAVESPNYRFKEWQGDASGSSANYSLTMNGDKSVKAVFELVEHTLTTAVVPFEGGTISPANGSSYTHGNEISIEATEQTGYSFVEWGGALSGNANPATLIMDADKSVTATFDRNRHEFRALIPQGGGLIAIPSLSQELQDDQTTTVDWGTSLNIVAEPETGYAFSHWGSDTNDSNPSKEITVAGDLQITANFTLVSQVELKLIPRSAEAEPGDVVTVDIHVANAENLYGYEIDVTYTPSELGVGSIIEGDFLSEAGTVNTFWLAPTIVTDSSLIQDVTALRLTPGLGATGNGVLASLAIQIPDTIGTGESVHLQFVQPDTKLSDPNANEIPISSFSNATISVIETNEAPTGISLSNNSVDESMPSDTVIGSFSTSDPDIEDSFTYSLVSGGEFFSIIGNTLISDAAFDFESNSNYQIEVRTTDQGGLYHQEIFTISVLDVDERSPAAQWIDDRLPAETPISDRGLLGDPDRDGIVNIVEYAMGMNPASVDSHQPIRINLDSETKEMTFEIRGRSDDSAIIYVCEFSSDLSQWNSVTLNFNSGTQTWSTDSSEIRVSSAQTLDGGMWKIELEDSSGYDPLFIRMNITYTP